ncbi:hypothetical protein [Legionella feeleii]|uniref:Uncharacterized protein n=1 Tax=Legionella feeleii TaxID=453 RepID=A0A378IW47_9GAMM|nr:hypothetical protein [Legionella feeleii]STX39283.1 Uncharacterised protein [Legionella feeleii]
MPKLTQLKQNLLKEIVLHYLQGEAVDVIKCRLQGHSQALNRGGNALFETIRIEQGDPFITAILASLAIEVGEHERLFNRCDNLHDLLTQLYQEGHYHLRMLLKLLDETRPARSGLASIAAVLTILGLGAWAYQSGTGKTLVVSLEKLAAKAPGFLSRVFSQLRNFLLLGIVFSSARLVFNWRNTLTSITKTTSHKVYTLFFTTLASALTLTGLTLCYLAGGSMSPLIAGLLVSASAVEVIKGISSLVLNQRTKHSLSLSVHEESWQGIAQTVRFTNLMDRTFYTLFIKVASALLNTAFVAVWSVSPPVLLLTASCLGLMMVTTLIKSAALANLDKHFAVKLQSCLQGIDMAPDASLCPSAHPTALKLKEIKETLDTQKRFLLQREEQLRVRDNAICETLMAIEKGASSPAKALLGLGGSRESLPDLSANEEMGNEDLHTQSPLFMRLELVETHKKQPFREVEENILRLNN